MVYDSKATFELAPDAEDKQDAPATTDDIRKEVGAKPGEPKDILPENLACNPQVMIIANQNVNWDNEARLTA
jgi:hypothetical protein